MSCEVREDDKQICLGERPGQGRNRVEGSNVSPAADRLRQTCVDVSGLVAPFRFDFKPAIFLPYDVDLGSLADIRDHRLFKTGPATHLSAG